MAHAFPHSSQGMADGQVRALHFHGRKLDFFGSGARAQPNLMGTGERIRHHIANASSHSSRRVEAACRFFPAGEVAA